MSKLQVLLAAIVAGASLSIAVAAQAQPYGGMGPGHGHGMGMHGGRGGMMAGDPVANAEQRLATMKTQLQINSSQDATWQAFATASKQQATVMQAMRAQMQQGGLTAPERMAQRTAAMQQRGTGMAAVTSAFSALYAVLSPEQKLIADQNCAAMGGHGKRGGPRAG